MLNCNHALKVNYAIIELVSKSVADDNCITHSPHKKKKIFT